MADYYPLLARAVAGLPANTARSRGNVYERARRALLAQLRGVEPPLPEVDIERERSALEVAISRIELEYLGSDDPFADIVPPPEPPPSFTVTPPPPVAPPTSAAPPPAAAPSRIGDRLPERPAPRSFAERVRLELPATLAAPPREAADPVRAPLARPPEPAPAPVDVRPVERPARPPVAADVPPADLPPPDVPAPVAAEPGIVEPAVPDAPPAEVPAAASEQPEPAVAEPTPAAPIPDAPISAAPAPRVPFWSRGNAVRVNTPRAEPTLDGRRDEALRLEPPRVEAPVVDAPAAAWPGAGAPPVDLPSSAVATDEPANVPPVAVPPPPFTVTAPTAAPSPAPSMPPLARNVEPPAAPAERPASGGRSLPLGGLLRRATATSREPVAEARPADDAFPDLRDGRQGYQPDLVFADPPSLEPEPRDGFDMESLDAEARVGRPELDWEVTEPDVAPAQPRRWGRLVVVLLVLALLGGGVALGFSQREKVIGWIGDLRSGTSQAVAPAPAPSHDQAAEGQAPAKSTDRVSQSPAAPAPEAAAETPAPAAAQPAAAPVVRSTSTPIPVNAQRAVLFEENAGGGQQGLQQFVGTVVWSTESFDAGNGNGPDIGIRAVVEIPDRQIKVDMNLRRNQDQTLPASHIIELRFDLPADFDLGTVANVPGVRAKPTEGAQGVPLTGLAVRVTPGFFLVGLSALNNERQRNLALLITRNWLDIPLVFSNGRRGILALEKGPTGDSAFREAFSAWGLPIPQQTSRPAGQPADGAAAPAPAPAP
ncbi:hypothetical protein [Ancylobacter lacus]|uniref:hypothetical protein n=1 Tax=Ancylobacter lacus TaxID=2579970 RepID=UPI001BD0F80C|nr:hypothetical protein [Ancylobacter lacus]MBS7540128.1 hypothetical protein [Ancylobacter lacus]